MKVDSFWRCTGSAGVYLSVESGKDTTDERLCLLCKYSEYIGLSKYSVPKEVDRLP